MGFVCSTIPNNKAFTEAHQFFNLIIVTPFVDINADGSIGIVAINEREEAKSRRLTLQSKTADLQIPAHGIQTLVLNN